MWRTPPTGSTQLPAYLAGTCVGMCPFNPFPLSSSSIFRWKYGSKTRGPNTRRLWRTGPVDPKGSTSPLLRPPLPRPAPCGTSAWPPKGHRCTLERTWTILPTGTRGTSRTPCRGLRWCDRQEDAAPLGQTMDLYQRADWRCRRRRNCWRCEQLWGGGGGAQVTAVKRSGCII